MIDLDAARGFLWRNGRLLERLEFAHRFEGASSEHVLDALRAFQNDDGGFGNALEPDLRGPDSQPIFVDFALRVLSEIGLAPPTMLARTCTYLQSVTEPDGGLRAINDAVSAWPRGEHWQPAAWTSSLNPTAMIAGLLHSLKVGHSYLDAADIYVWRKLEGVRPEGGPTLAAIYCFLNNAPDRRRAVQYAEEVASAIPDAPFFALDPPEPAAGYALTPLDLAPTPDALAGGLFAPELLDAHLDALAELQRPDGGWPVSWEPPTPAALLEWRGRETLRALITLQNYGRI